MNEATGELSPFQVTVQRKRKYGIAERAREFPLILFVFDLLYADTFPAHRGMSARR